MGYKEFYKSKNINLMRVKEIGLKKHNIHSEQIDQGARNLYDKIVSGEYHKDISLVYRIWAEAKIVPYVEEPTHPNRFEYRISQLELHWWKRDKWAWLFLHKNTIPTAL